MFIYCDFGDALPGREVDVYRELLKANLFLYNGTGPVFALSSETGRVVFDRHFRLDQLDPDMLQGILAQMEQQAAAWRTDQFLNGPQG